MLQLELILQTKKLMEHYQKEKMKECNFLGLRAKTDSYFTDDSSDNKKAKNTKVCHQTKT